MTGFYARATLPFNGLNKKQKNAILNCHVSTTRTNVKSRLTFSESLFDFFSRQRYFLRAVPTCVHGRGEGAGAPPTTPGSPARGL